MIRIIKIVTIIFQIGLTIGVSFILYLLFAMFNYQGGIANFVGVTLFQPFFAIILSILTVIICGLVGLPIRFNHELNIWWRTHFYISILISLLGLVMCVISILPGFVEEVTYRMDGMDITQTVPNQLFSTVGWFLVAIGALHFYPPKFIYDKVEQLILRNLQ